MQTVTLSLSLASSHSLSAPLPMPSPTGGAAFQADGQGELDPGNFLVQMAIWSVVSLCVMILLLLAVSLLRRYFRNTADLLFGAFEK